MRCNQTLTQSTHFSNMSDPQSAEFEVVLKLKISTLLYNVTAAIVAIFQNSIKVLLDVFLGIACKEVQYVSCRHTQDKLF